MNKTARKWLAVNNKDKKKEEDLARRDMNDASIEENDEEENEIASQEIEPLVQGNYFCHLVIKVIRFSF